MNIEKYTERARGFIQSAQTYALGQGHQQFAPEHLLKVLLDDPEGHGAGLIERAGGRAKDARLATEAALARMPKVSGGSGQLYLAKPLARVFATAEQVADKAGDSFVTVERLLLALADGKGRADRAHPRRRRRDADRAERPPSTTSARAARPIRPPPNPATTRSRSMRATLPRMRATANSTR
jgi:ATP-dependent Clp protease ATP-binding subunit ClpA